MILVFYKTLGINYSYFFDTITAHNTKYHKLQSTLVLYSFFPAGTIDTFVYESEKPEGSAAGMSLASFIVTVAILSSPLNDIENRIRPKQSMYKALHE